MSKSNLIGLVIATVFATAAVSESHAADLSAPPPPRNDLHFDARGDDSEARVDVRGWNNRVRGRILGDGAQTGLTVVGEGLKVDQLQFGPSASSNFITGSNSEAVIYTPPCASGRPSRLHLENEAFVGVETCR